MRCVVALLMLISLDGWTTAQESTTQDDTLEGELLSLEETFMKAWQKHDMKAARATLAPDFVIVEQAGIESADQELKLLSSCILNSYKYQDVQLHRTSQTTATLIYKVNVDMTCNGHSMNGPSLFTDTFVRTSKGWLLRISAETKPAKQ